MQIKIVLECGPMPKRDGRPVEYRWRPLFNAAVWLTATTSRDLRSLEIRFDFESNFRFGIRFVVMILFEIFESSAPSIVLCKETIGGG